MDSVDPADAGRSVRSRPRVPSITRRIARAFACAAAVATAFAVPGLPTHDAVAADVTPARNADMLLGSDSYTAARFGDGSKMLYGMAMPHGVAVDSSGSVFVSDYGANRVMRWGTTPATNGAAITNVVGSFADSTTSWAWGCSGGSNQPAGIEVVGDGAGQRLFVAEDRNNRVQVFTAEPTTNAGNASFWLGQSSGSSCSENRGAANPSATTLDGPLGVWSDGTMVAVADTGNHRVLLWNSMPASGNTPADVVLGQADFVSNLPNRGGSAAANTLNLPSGVHYDGSYLYVADRTNNRVLVWTGWPATNGAAANYVLGQADFVSTSGSCTTGGLSDPWDVTTTGSGAGHVLAVAVRSHRRVAIRSGWQAAPASGGAWTSVVGQPSTSNCSSNRGGATAAANSMRYPHAVAFDSSNRLWVADEGNHRVLRFDAVTGDPSAALVLGHAGAGAMTNSVRYDGDSANMWFVDSAASTARSTAEHVATLPGGGLIASGVSDDAVRVWTSEPASIDQPFSSRFGQALLTDSGGNRPSWTTSAASFDYPADTWSDGTRLLVADRSNDRVLVWTSWPSSAIDPADYVLGQADFVSSNAGLVRNRFENPSGVASDGSDIYVSDNDNNRILVFRDFFAAPANGKDADIVLGQANFTTAAQGRTQVLMNDPGEIALDQDVLAVADENNERILIWNEVSTIVPDAQGAGPPADAVVGQSDFTSQVGGTRTDSPGGVDLRGNALFFTSSSGSLEGAYILDPVPTSGATLAPTAIEVGVGEADEVPAQNGTGRPSSIAARDGRIWVSMGGQGRIMRWTDTITPTFTVAPSASPNCDGTTTISFTTSESTTSEVYFDTSSQGSYVAYGSSEVDTTYTGLTHAVTIPTYSANTTYYFRVRGVDWAGHEVISSEYSFVTGNPCSPTLLYTADADASSGSTNPTDISPGAPHFSFVNASGESSDRMRVRVSSSPLDNVVGLWHFDGDATDSSGLVNDMSEQVPTADISYTAGQPNFGSAATFDGDDHVERAYDPDFDLDTFTLEAWVRTSYSAGIQTISSRQTGASNNNWRWRMTGSGDLAIQFSIGGVGAGAGTSGLALNDGNWHHVAVAVDGPAGTADWVVDGAFIEQDTFTGGNVDNPATSVEIGRQGGSLWFNGDIDDVRISSVARDPAELAGAYATDQPHGTLMWDSNPADDGQPLTSTCAYQARCDDIVYGLSGNAGTARTLQPSGRYWVTAKHRQLDGDWSDWSSPDWFELDVHVLSIGVDSPTVALGDILAGQDTVGTTTVTASTNDPEGYTLLANDESDSWGADCACGGTVPDWTGTSTTPTVWAAGSGGWFGITTRDATGGRLAKWGTGTGTTETDFTNNLYAGLRQSSSTVIHSRSGPAGPDSVVVTYRSNVAAAQQAGTYDATVIYTAVGNP